MSAQPPRPPSPADLARVRPAPVQPLPAPSRARRLAELQKERAEQALRSAVAAPTTDFAAMDADEFFTALRCACQEGIVNAALMADTGRRLAEGTTGSRDLHQLLFVAGDDHRWGELRSEAMAAVARRPHLAVEVVHLEAQRLAVAPVRVAESAGEQGFTARASLERDGVPVEGRRCAGTSKKRAAHAAVLSLLAALVELPVPEVGPAGATGSGSDTSQAAPAITPAEVQTWLEHVVGLPEPDAGLAGHLAAGHLTVRSLYLLLFEAEPRGWRRHRAAAWDALVAAPSQAPGVLSMRTQASAWPPASYLEVGEGTAVAVVATPDGPVVGEPAVATGVRAARVSAALALVRDLAPAIDSDGDGHGDGDGDRAQGAPAPTANPVGRLNERAQTGVIVDLDYTQEATGPAHQPVFTCTASCVHAAERHVAAAEATSKHAAKAAAAAALLEQVVTAEREHLASLARARRDQARSPEGIFTRLLRAGCPVDFTGWGFLIGGDLPEPLVGCEVSVPAALPVLAALDGRLHPSARVWASATRAALAAIAARRVYPALDATGRDCWRLALDGPSGASVAAAAAAQPAVTAFVDTVAETLLRSPGAPLVIGDLPYAGRPRPLDPDAADWADRAAEAAEGVAGAALVIRLALPDGPGLPLRARLRAAGPSSTSPPGRHPGGEHPHDHRSEGPHDPVAQPHDPVERQLGRAEQRLLRRATRDWPPLGRVWRDGTLGGAEAAELLGPVGQRLAALGVAVEWPAGLVSASGLGRQILVVSAGAGSGGRSPAGVAELTWQLSLDGAPLTEDETLAAAEAVTGVVRLRGRWVVIDAETRRLARERHAGRLTEAQALDAALTGQVALGGRAVACSAAGRLADLVAALRGAGSDRPAAVADPDGLHATLRGYQRLAVRWLVRTTSLGFGALLADEMGLGKTLTVIAYRLVRASAGPSLVICPASLVVNWERELARFAPDVTVRRYHATGRSLDALAPGEVVVTTYGTLLRDASALAGVAWDLVVADEAQQVKNHRSQAARALRLLRPAARIAVTGTPVENSLAELWSILDWTNPGLFGSLATFRDRFARAAEREAIGSTVGPGAAGAAEPDAAHRLRRLIAPFVLRRRKSDPEVAPELPDKVVNDRYVELSREQAALYQAATAQALDQIAASDGPHRRGQVLRLLQALRQICNSPAHYLRESPDGWDAAAQAARSGKLGLLEELMESVVLTDDAALIFTGYVAMGNLIRAHLAACGIRAEFLHGGVPVGERHRIVDRFQSGDGDALILSVRAAGTGLNLTRAGHVIHFDRPWNPAVEDQATDRAHRIGQHRLVEVHHLITEGTVEDRIAGLLAGKRGLTEAVLPRGHMALAELTDGELSTLVRLGTGPGTGGAA